MSITTSRADGAWQEKIGEIDHLAPEPDVVERLLAAAYQETAAAGEREHGSDDDGHSRPAIVVTRRTDDAGNPIGYLLMSSETA